GRHDGVAPRRAGEVAVGAEPYRPDRVALVLPLRGLPARIVERRAAPDRVIEPHLVASRVAVHADAPHAPAGERKIPALRRELEAALAVADPGARIGIEADRAERRRLAGFGVKEAWPALHTVIVVAEVGTG